MIIILSQIFQLLKVVLQIIGVQFKEKKHILISFVFVNLFAAAGYILLKEYSGLIVCSIAIAQTTVQFFLIKKERKHQNILLQYI